MHNKIIKIIFTFLCVLSSYSLLSNTTFYRNDAFHKLYQRSVKNANLDKDLYAEQVRPIIDKRCVVCHSCTEAPCQLKLESTEGLIRGAHKQNVRGRFLSENQGNRLFFDGHSEEDWRRKGFYSVIDPVDGKPSVMFRALVQNEYDESSPLMNYQMSYEMSILSEKKISQMPFGLTPLDQEKELKPMVEWLLKGAPLPNENSLNHLKQTFYPHVVTAWENFFNNKSHKGQWTARYLYEHLFETHFYIDEAPGEFFEIVRSRTPAPEPIDVISSRHEFDDPNLYDLKNGFYYRLRKVHSTVVFKNHILFHVNEGTLNHLKQMFWFSDWGKESERINFDFQHSNPFMAFRAIPAKIRYQWMLENAVMLMKVIMSGPNCRVSNAGSMIWDNYITMFVKPDSDITVMDPKFFEKTQHLLLLPNFSGGDDRYIGQYDQEQIEYARIKTPLQMKLTPNGLSFDDIWTGQGKNKNSLISIFRHMSYATAHQGYWVDKPRSVHLFNYAIFERLYYLCVLATTTRDGQLSQLPVVRYLFDLKKELDEHFLSIVPENLREKFRQSFVGPKGKKYDYDVNFAMPFNGHNHKFLGTEIVDPVKYIEKIVKTIFPESIIGHQSFLTKSIKDAVYVQLSALNNSKNNVARYFPDITYVQVLKDSGLPQNFTLLVNRHHTFLNRALTDKESWDPVYDQFQVLQDIQVDFPQKIYRVSERLLSDFLRDINLVNDHKSYRTFDQKYGLQKTAKNFWNILDEIQVYFHRQYPISAGVLDLNKYGIYDFSEPKYQ